MMTKISLFVLAGLISGSTADGCFGLNKEECNNRRRCAWTGNFCGGKIGGVIHLDQEDYVVDKLIDSSASGSVSSGDGSDKYNYYDYNLDYEDEDVKKSYLRARK